MAVAKLKGVVKEKGSDLADFAPQDIALYLINVEHLTCRGGESQVADFGQSPDLKSLDKLSKAFKPSGSPEERTHIPEYLLSTRK